MDIYDILRFLLEVLLAAAGALAAMWKFVKAHVANEIKIVCTHLNTEVKERKTADTNIESRVMDNSQKLHNNMGRLEIIRSDIEEQKREQVKEIYELKSLLQNGLHDIQIQLERLRQDGHLKKGED